MTESMIRGGISAVYDKRLCVANNKYLDSYDSAKQSTFIAMIDPNNLYGGIMKNFCLPTGGFVIHDQNNIPETEILNASTNDQIGYIVEVDLEYPSSLHDLHKDFPLAPHKIKIDPMLLGEYQTELLV